MKTNTVPENDKILKGEINLSVLKLMYLRVGFEKTWSQKSKAESFSIEINRNLLE